MLDDSNKNSVTKRLFVGGLATNVTSEEIEQRFSRFGKISGLCVKVRKDEAGNTVKCFAHLNIEGNEGHIKKCFDSYQNTKWKGSVLKLQYAKESFVSRLEKERAAAEETKASSDDKEELRGTWRPPEFEEIKGGAVPGTPVPGKKDWVVGKYGRILPVLKVKKSEKTVKHDPSKLCHTVKVFKEVKGEDAQDPSCDSLTWEITTPDSEMSKKRKGQFPQGSAEKRRDGKKADQGVEATKERVSQYLNQKDAERLLKYAGDLEVVTQKSGMTPKAVKSNKFDSDIESDGEHDATLKLQREPVKSKFDSDIESDGDDNAVRSPYQRVKKGPKLNNDVTSKDKHETSQDKKPKKFEKFASDNESDADEDSIAKIPTKKQKLSISTVNGDVIGNTKEGSKEKKKTPLKPSLSAQSGSGSKDSNFKNDHGNKISPGKGKFGKRAGPLPKIPAFKGLGMLGALDGDSTVSVVTDRRQNSSTLGETVVADASSPKASEITPSSSSLGKGVVGKDVQKEGKRRKKQESEKINDKPEGKDSDTASGPLRSIKSPSNSDNTSHKVPGTRKSQDSPKKRKSLQATSALKDNVVVFFERDAGKDGYGSDHSASSADSYEIIARKKRKLSNSGQSNVSGKQNSDSQSKDSKFSEKKKKSTGDIATLDKELSISEFYSGADDFHGNVDTVTSSSTSKRVDEGELDSDLDDNDFEKVAKRLAQIAGVELTEQPSKKKKKDGKKGDQLNTKTVGEGRSSTESSMVSQVDKKQKKDKSIGLADSSSQGKPLDKKSAANEKRLEAVKEQMKAKQRQQEIMKKALASLDAPENNKIVFDSDSDEAVNGDKEEVLPASESKSVEKKEGSKELKLFADSSDEDSDDADSDYEEMFKSKPHFEGKKGEKLMKLERKIGDNRFKLDEKFVESDSEDEEEEERENEDKEDENANLLKEEREASMKVLENVIGKSKLDQFTAKMKRNTKHIVDMNSVRFDPTKLSTVSSSKSNSEPPRTKKDDHTTSAFEDLDGDRSSNCPRNAKPKKMEFVDPTSLKDERKKNEAKEAQKKTEKSKDGKTPSSEKKSDADKPASKSKVEMSSSLINLFKKDGGAEEEEQSFSLMSQFGGDDVMEEEETSKPLSGLFANKTKQPDVLSQSLVKTSRDMDSSSESGSEEAEVEVKTPSTACGKKGFSAQMSSDSDISDDEEDNAHSEDSDDDENDDKSIRESERSESGDREQDMETDVTDPGRVDVRFTKEEWLEKWPELRLNIVKIYKKKHKEAIKNKKVQNEAKRRKEFLQSSKKSPWFRKKK